MIGFISIALAAVHAPSGWKAEVMKPYRECALAAAKELALSGASGPKVVFGAADACKNTENIALLAMISHYRLSVHEDGNEVLYAAFVKVSEPDQVALIREVSRKELDSIKYDVAREIERIVMAGRNR